jgi:hypothetical protein
MIVFPSLDPEPDPILISDPDPLKHRIPDPGGSGSRSTTLKGGLAKKVFSQFISFCGRGEL